MKEAMSRWMDKYRITFSIDTARSICDSLGLDGENVDECLAFCYQLEKGDISEADFTGGLCMLSGKKPEEVMGVLGNMKANPVSIKEKVKSTLPSEFARYIYSPIWYKAMKVAPEHKVDFWGKGIYLAPTYDGAARWGEDIREVTVHWDKMTRDGVKIYIASGLQTGLLNLSTGEFISGIGSPQKADAVWGGEVTGFMVKNKEYVEVGNEPKKD